MPAFLVALMLIASGLLFHGLGRSIDPRVRRWGPWIVVVGLSIVSVGVLGPFYRLDMTRLWQTYVIPQFVFSGIILSEGALLTRRLLPRLPGRVRFLAAYAALMAILGTITMILVVAGYPGS